MGCEEVEDNFTPPWWEKATYFFKAAFSLSMLLTIQNKESFLIIFLYSDLRNNHWWVGGRKVNTVWQWMTSLYPSYAATYTYWAPGEPNDTAGKEECLEMYHYQHDFRWNDIPCNDNQPYICETHYSNVFGWSKNTSVQKKSVWIEGGGASGGGRGAKG